MSGLAIDGLLPRNKKLPLLNRLVGASEQDRVGIARAAIPGRSAAGCDIHHSLSG
jgi:hypothetical protein